MPDEELLFRFFRIIHDIINNICVEDAGAGFRIQFQNFCNAVMVKGRINHAKLVPREWVNKEGNYVTKDFIDYVKPLIQGDYQPIMVNGLPRHLVLDMKKK